MRRLIHDMVVGCIVRLLMICIRLENVIRRVGELKYS